MALGIIAKTISEEKLAANHAGCTAGVEVGWAVLVSGGKALEVVDAMEKWS